MADAPSLYTLASKISPVLRLSVAGQDVLGRTPVTGFLRHLGALAACLIAFVALACSGMEEPTGTVESVPTASPVQATIAALTPTQTATAAPTATPLAAVSPAPIATPPPTPVATPTQPQLTATQPSTATADYDSTENMFRLFSGLDHNPDDTRQAVALAVINNDKSMVPVMIEMLRFFQEWDLVKVTEAAISDITGEEFVGVWSAWQEWMEWLGSNADDYGPPDEYVRWKGALMSLIDPRFGEFLAPAANGSRINVFEIAWGGVRPDGIPDLQNAPVVSADEQKYLYPDDRVFGVSINGEHRAYPLRIVNAHEMANDVLGGEPIALAY